MVIKVIQYVRHRVICGHCEVVHNNLILSRTAILCCLLHSCCWVLLASLMFPNTKQSPNLQYCSSSCPDMKLIELMPDKVVSDPMTNWLEHWSATATGVCEETRMNWTDWWKPPLARSMRQAVCMMDFCWLIVCVCVCVCACARVCPIGSCRSSVWRRSLWPRRVNGWRKDSSSWKRAWSGRSRREGESTPSNHPTCTLCCRWLRQGALTFTEPKGGPWMLRCVEEEEKSKRVREQCFLQSNGEMPRSPLNQSGLNVEYHSMKLC